MLRGLAVLHLTVVGELGGIAVEKANSEICKGQHSSNFLRWNRNDLLSTIHASRPTELKEVRREALPLKSKIESRLCAPHCFFETHEFDAIRFADNVRNQCGLNAG